MRAAPRHAPSYLTHASARALHRCLATCASVAAAEVLAQEREELQREREQQREAGRRRRGQEQQRGWSSACRRRRRHGLRGRRGGATSCTARVRDAGGSDTALWDVNLDPIARGPADHEHLGRSPAFSPLSPLSFSLLDAGRSRADFLFGVRVALIGRDRPSTSHLLLRRGHVGQHLMTCRL